MKTYSKIIKYVWVLLAVLCLAYAVYINYHMGINAALALYIFSGICAFQYVVRKYVIDKKLRS